jgi:Patatin-like phospholipase
MTLHHRPRSHHALRRVILALTAITLNACAAVHRPSTTVSALLADADSARATERSLRDTVVARLARRVIAKPDHSVDVLMLSGGGQNGAYGVGFLRGWRARSIAPMPQFDLITGVSTGAIQSPFILLNTTAAIDTLTDLYRSAADRVAPSLDWFFWLRKTGGLVNTKRFDASLQRVVNDAFRDSLRREFAIDRQVVFNTTDLDIATGRTFDLSQVLGTDSSGLTRTRQLLKAATSIPGIFPPVVYDGHVHSDGGITANILTLLTLDDYRRMMDRVRAAGVTSSVSVRVWVIVNGWTHSAPAIVNPANRKQIAGRWSTLMFYMNQPQVVQGLEYLTIAASNAIPGLSMQLHWTAIPSELGLEPDANTLFKKSWMQRLEALGTQRALSAAPWDSIVSPYVRPVSLNIPEAKP